MNNLVLDYKDKFFSREKWFKLLSGNDILINQKKNLRHLLNQMLFNRMFLILGKKLEKKVLKWKAQCKMIFFENAWAIYYIAM